MITAPAQLATALPRRRGVGWPRWDVRLVARLGAVRLDRELAAGVPSWSSRYHAVRSLQLTTPRRRRCLARSLEELATRAERPKSLQTAVIMPCREQVRVAAPMISIVAQRLRGSEPVSSRGIAELTLLLGDGGGPCYARTYPEALCEALEAAAVDLEAAGG
jgi:hypothetical protein